MKFEQFQPKIQEPQELEEVRMGQGDFNKLLKSGGATAGFEAELCFRGIGGGGDPDYDNPEENMDEDRRARSIDDICDFFYDGDYNGRRDIESLREKMEGQYQEWVYEQLSEKWSEAETEAVKEYIENNDFDWNGEVEDYLRDELGLSEQQVKVAMAAGKEGAQITSSKQLALFADENEAYAHWAEARDHVEEKLDEMVEESIGDQDRNYDRAREEWEEEHRDEYDEEDWLNGEGIDAMSDVPGQYEVTWPYWTYPESTSGFNESSAQDLAEDLEQSLGLEDVVASSGYHSTSRRPGRWIIEEDGSLEADNEGDMPAEIVSPPMPIEECLDKLKEFADWAKGQRAYTNDSTGLHVGVSLPDVGGKVDYIKLALFIGDQRVLAEFGRESNGFARSAAEKIRNSTPEQIASTFEAMRNGMAQSAGQILGKLKNDNRYTSINMKDDYIEFRSMGGDNYLDQIDQIINNIKVFAMAMSRAAIPADQETPEQKKEYAKKLYKLLDKSGGGDMIKYFALWQSGQIEKSQLKSVLKNAQVERIKAKQPAASEYWWKVSVGGGSPLAIEVKARNKGEANIKAAQAWGVPAQATGNWTITHITDPATIQRLENRPDVDI